MSVELSVAVGRGDGARCRQRADATIEGRDEAGEPRAWYVRLWNYAEGTAEDAEIGLDFADLNGGFLLPGEADPVWAGDIDRMFVSLVPPGYTAIDAPLGAPVEGWVEISD